MTEKPALLVIDIQKDNLSSRSPYPFDPTVVDNMIETVNRITSTCAAAQIPVIFIRQIFDGFPGTLFSKLLLKGITLKGSPGAELDDRLNAAGSLQIDKSRQNGFIGTNLESELEKLTVDTLYMCGLDGAYCVSATAKGGLLSGRNVIYIDDAIITNKPKRWEKLRAETISQGAALCSSEDFMRQHGP